MFCLGPSIRAPSHPLIPAAEPETCGRCIFVDQRTCFSRVDAASLMRMQPGGGAARERAPAPLRVDVEDDLASHVAFGDELLSGTGLGEGEDAIDVRLQGALLEELRDGLQDASLR